ncbi:MAG: hypothetical protein GY754_21460 [bacterium]|nr:hypothetical protein [bacterium]
MKIKYIFVILISLLMAAAFSQIFNIPPYADDIYPLYKSAYFSGLERENRVITDAFLGVKTYGKPVYGWILLDDIKKNHSISIEVFNGAGVKIPAPGEKAEKSSEEILSVIQARNPAVISKINNGKFITIVPVAVKKSCLLCHKPGKKGIIGALRFEKNYSAHNFYSTERILLFVLIIIVLGVLLYAIIRWDPGKKVKELFDKS